MSLLRAIPELITAGILLALWLEPQHFGVEWFRSGVLTLLLEFFVIHSSGFMGVIAHASDVKRARRAAILAGIGAFYLLFMSAFAWIFSAWWMLAVFAWLTFGKMQATWSREPAEGDRERAVVSWALAVPVYIGCVAASVLLDVPEMGVTDDVRAASRFDPKGGAWEAEPYRALAGGVLYFTIMALSRPVLARAFRPQA